MSDDFKKIAAREIEEFKAEYRAAFPGRDAEELTDEDLLREVMNTVGKPGKLGEHVKCVVSVSMLTEGWDANTVTHVLGVRAFGTQLLCEQVVGRALRRMSYAANDEGRFERRICRSLRRAVLVHSVQRRDAEPKPGRCRPASARWKTGSPARSPFRGCSATATTCRTNGSTHVHRRLEAGALDRRHSHQGPRIAPIVGETSIHTLDDLKRRRPNEVAFLLAKLTLEKYFRDDDGKRRTSVALSPTAGHRQTLAGRMRHAQGQHVSATAAAHRVRARRRRPHLQGHRRVAAEGTPRSSRSCAPTTPRLHPLRGFRHHPTGLCHARGQVPRLPCRRRHRLLGAEDGAGAGRHGEVSRYVKNHNLGFTIPYTLNGEEQHYIPDFIVAARRRPGRQTTC